MLRGEDYTLQQISFIAFLNGVAGPSRPAPLPLTPPLGNLALSPEGKLIRVVAGPYDLAPREGCRTVDRMLRMEIDAPYDPTGEDGPSRSYNRG